MIKQRFYANLGRMQVHLTLILVVIIILITGMVKRQRDAAPSRDRQFICCIRHSVGGVGVSHLPSLRNGRRVSGVVRVHRGCGRVFRTLWSLLWLFCSFCVRKALRNAWTRVSKCEQERAVSMSVGARYRESVRPRAWSRSGEGKTTDENTGNTVDVDAGSVDIDNPLEASNWRDHNAVKSAATEPATAPAADHQRGEDSSGTRRGRRDFRGRGHGREPVDLPSAGEEVDAPG